MKVIQLQNIKDVKTLAAKLEIILRDLEKRIEEIRVKKSDVMGNKPRVLQLGLWFGTKEDQMYIRRPDGTDKPVG